MATNMPSYYEYDEDYSSDDCSKEDVIAFGSIATPIIFCLVIILSLFGNLLVLVILIKYENLKSITNRFIFNLALSDLMFTLGLPFWAFYHHMHEWTLGDTTCKVVNFVFYAGFYSSVLFLTMMTLQRYRAVVYPLSDRGENRTHFALALTLLVWALSVVAAMPATLHNKVQTHNNKSHCQYDDINWKKAAAYQQNIFFFIAFGIMCFCYSRILQTVLKSPSSKKIRTVKLIFVIVVVFLVGWAPYNIVIFLKSLSDQNPFNDCDVSIRLDYAFYSCRLIAFSHCCLNPVFYAFVGVKFRKHLKVIIHKISPPPQASLESQRTRMVALPSQGSMY
ncbi:chemokine XC receptor 1-like [Clupea harengus]|uniref:Chemokine XC receptor 1-like n=1 Tax=Clupea harengus TaxID=7950 RepID=A0A6P8FT49_CLUHA|nr:chemokine XC receptor 1-like [Clupea harengus]